MSKDKRSNLLSLYDRWAKEKDEPIRVIKKKDWQKKKKKDKEE